MDNLTELQRELCRLRDVWAPHPSERKAGNSHVCRAKQITYDHAADLVAEFIATVKAARDEKRTEAVIHREIARNVPEIPTIEALVKSMAAINKVIAYNFILGEDSDEAEGS